MVVGCHVPSPVASRLSLQTATPGGEPTLILLLNGALIHFGFGSTNMPHLRCWSVCCLCCPPSPASSPQGEGITLHGFQSAKDLSTNPAAGHFQDAGNVSPFPGVKIGMKVVVPTIFHQTKQNPRLSHSAGHGISHPSRARVLAHGHHWQLKRFRISYQQKNGQTRKN